MSESTENIKTTVFRNRIPLNGGNPNIPNNPNVNDKWPQAGRRPEYLDFQSFIGI